MAVDGHVNCDLYQTGATNVVFDAQEPWPLKEHSVSQIISSHFLEHVERPKAYFKEAWRVLHDNGVMAMRLPHGAHDSWYADLTHTRPWHPASFCFLQPGYLQETKNPQHRWREFYAIDVVEIKVHPLVMACGRWPLKYVKIVEFAVTYLRNVCSEMYVFLRALKSEYTIREYLNTGRKANSVPILYVKDWIRDKSLY